MTFLFSYKVVVNFYQVRVLSRLGLFKPQEVAPVDEKLSVITCKSPLGLTRQQRYARIKNLMQR